MSESAKLFLSRKPSAHPHSVSLFSFLQLCAHVRVIRDMPMYYFNLKGNGQHRPVDVPIDFVNLDVAKAQVIQSIRIAFDETPEEYQISSLRFFYEICDEDGEVLDVVTFRDAIMH